MDSINRQRTGVGLSVFVLCLTLFTVIATGAIAFAVTESPRGFIFWTLTLFLCAAEFLVGIITLYRIVTSTSLRRLSGAVLSIIYGVVGLYLVVGLVSIVLYSALRAPDGGKDHVFLGILAAETVLAFLVAAIICAYDLHVQVYGQASTQARALHSAHAASLRTAIHALQDVSLNDPIQSRALAGLLKKLERIEASLAHSHGGGVNSREGGSVDCSQETEKAIADAVTLIGQVAGSLPSGDGGDVNDRLSRMNELAASLDTTLDLMGL